MYTFSCLISILVSLLIVPAIHSQQMTVKNLVLEGGGVKGIAYVGAFKALKELGMYENDRYLFDAVSGTSAGCLFGAMVALGIPPEKLELIVKTTDFDGDFFDYKFRDLMSIPWPPTASFSYMGRMLAWIGKASEAFLLKDSPGMNTGDKYMAFFINKILPLSPYADKLGPDPTFEDLDSISPVGLTCYGARLGVPSSIAYSVKTVPTMKLKTAVFHSGNLPVMFKPTQDMFGCVVIDGGLYQNFPINAYDTASYTNPHTLGLSLNAEPNEEATAGCVPSKKRDDRIVYSNVSTISYIEQLLDGLISAHDVLTYYHDPRNAKRIIFLDPKITTVSFDINETVREEVMNRAYDNVMRYFKRYHAKAPLAPSITKDIKLNEKRKRLAFQLTPTLMSHLERVGFIQPSFTLSPVITTTMRPENISITTSSPDLSLGSKAKMSRISDRARV